MKTNNSASNPMPTANIAVNKSRIRCYSTAGDLPTYYLQKGQEFQIEIFNPTTDVVLAKITLNGNALSQGGLVLNPGQRVFLDRYLDVAKKFLFDTYEVSKSAEVQKAIEKNGDFKVQFFREQRPQPSWPTSGTLHLNNLNGTLRTSNSNNASFFSGNIANCSTSVNPNGIGSNATYSSGLGLQSFNTSEGSATLDWMDQEQSRGFAGANLSDEPISKSLSKSRSKKTIETGRVEQGSSSDQTFKYVSKNFEYTAFHSVEYKMLPVSQKITEASEINVKMYCTQCGAKFGRTDNFCATCGNRK